MPNRFYIAFGIARMKPVHESENYRLMPLSNRNRFRQYHHQK